MHLDKMNSGVSKESVEHAYREEVLFNFLAVGKACVLLICFYVFAGHIVQEVEDVRGEQLLKDLWNHLMALLAKQLLHAESSLQRRNSLKLDVLEENFGEVGELVGLVAELLVVKRQVVKPKSHPGAGIIF
jgi:hypothetical protein